MLIKSKSQSPRIKHALIISFSKPSRSRYYNHNFLHFSAVFGEKFCVFLKNQCYNEIFAKVSFVLGQKRHFLTIFWLKI
jgi:hypothetical protein